MRFLNSMFLQGFSKEQKRFISLSSLSSGLEYYDFIMFVIFAKAIGQSFFSGALWLTLLASFAVFAVGYFGRPLGAVLFGHFGDRFGRKKSFIATALLMAVSSLLIGLLPGYASWGMAAPICLVILRVLQGISLGGELSGSLIYSIETAPPAHRALTSGIIFVGVNFGILLAYLVSYLIMHYAQGRSFNPWSWRIAFIVGGLLGIINFYLRRVLQESPIFVAQDKTKIERFPMITLLRVHFKKVLQGIGLVMMGAISNTIVFYMPTYLMVYFQIPLDKILLVNTINIIILTVEQILLGLLSDRYGRKRLLLSCAILYFLLSYPLFKSLSLGNVETAAVVLVVFALLNGLAGSCYPAMLVEIFPTQVRYSGFAISYNIAFALFAGLTPVILSYLIHVTGSIAIPGIYLSILGVIALFAIFSIKENYTKSLLQ